MHNRNSEDATTEKPALELLSELGWQTIDAFAESDGPQTELSGRETLDEVVLVKYLRPALERINSSLLLLRNCRETAQL
jgi:type I restriction enzyme R subunit